MSSNEKKHSKKVEEEEEEEEENYSQNKKKKDKKKKKKKNSSSFYSTKRGSQSIEQQLSSPSRSPRPLSSQSSARSRSSNHLYASDPTDNSVISSGRLSPGPLIEGNHSDTETMNGSSSSSSNNNNNKIEKAAKKKEEKELKKAVKKKEKEEKEKRSSLSAPLSLSPSSSSQKSKKSFFFRRSMKNSKDKENSSSSATKMVRTNSQMGFIIGNELHSKVKRTEAFNTNSNKNATILSPSSSSSSSSSFHFELPTEAVQVAMKDLSTEYLDKSCFLLVDDDHPERGQDKDKYDIIKSCELKTIEGPDVDESEQFILWNTNYYKSYNNNNDDDDDGDGDDNNNEQEEEEEEKKEEEEEKEENDENDKNNKKEKKEEEEEEKEKEKKKKEINDRYRVYARTVSSYPRILDTGGRQGDPICDCFAVRTYFNGLSFCICDGCGWGMASAKAAKMVQETFMKIMDDHIGLKENDKNDKIKSLKEIAEILIYAVGHAHNNILDDREPWECGTSTCVAGLLVDLVWPKENSNNQSMNEKKALIMISIGDCKAYRYSCKQNIFEDITLGNRQNLTNATDCGGRIGPTLGDDGRLPDLRNLRCNISLVDEGDIVWVVSDGVYDNFDPQYLGLSPQELAMYILPQGTVSDSVVTAAQNVCSITQSDAKNNSNEWDKLEWDIVLALKDAYSMYLFKQLLMDGLDCPALSPREALDTFPEEDLPLDSDDEHLTPKSITRTLIRYAMKTTFLTRSFMENNPNSRQPVDARAFPGKMDHTTCVAFRI